MPVVGIILSALLILPQLHATVINVPDDRPTIQAAVDSAATGDTIMLAPGAYSGSGNVNVDPGGKGLTIMSTDGPDSTGVHTDGLLSEYAFVLSSGEDSSFVVDGISVIGGTALSFDNGKGITLNGVSPVFRNCRFEYLGRSAITVSGGSPVFDSCRFALNEHGSFKKKSGRDSRSYAQAEKNPAVSLSGTSARFIECVFEGNHAAARRGGALDISGGAPRFESCGFLGNSATDIMGWPDGGAVALSGDSSEFLDCVFSNNFSQGMGGAVYADSTSQGMFTSCVFDENGSGYYGGAVHTSSDANSFSNCLFAANKSGDQTGISNYGGAIYSSGMVLVSGCTFVNNQASEGQEWDERRGAAIYGPASIVRSIFAYNSADSGAVEQVHPDSISCSNLFGNGNGDWVGALAGFDTLNGNMNLDPQFCDTANGVFTIAVGSPCAPANNACSTLIGAYGADCGGSPPVIDSVWIVGEDTTHVVSHTPVVAWSVSSDIPQTEYIIRFGVDTLWDYAEMWNPAPFVSPDTFLTYAGAPPVDGVTYYARLEVANSAGYSDPYDFSFRMNSEPDSVMPMGPLLDAVVTDSMPVLWVQNTTDAESDSLVYQFQLLHDIEIVDSATATEGIDSTSWQTMAPLAENDRFTWRVRAFDGYEYGPFSDTAVGTFFVNSTPQPPAASSLTSPTANPSDSLPLVDMLPVFRWTQVTDDDPMDTVFYRLEIDTLLSFETRREFDAGTSDSLPMTDSLAFRTHYFWRVVAYDTDSLETVSTTTSDFWTWTLGDFDFTHQCNVADLTFFVSYLFSGGPAMQPYVIGDVTGDCSVNIADLTLMVSYLFQSYSLRVGCE